jgi:hypothetical protein
LVEGYESKVAVHVIRLGKRMSAKGRIENELSVTLVRFQSHKFSIGSFHFKPEKSHTYQAFFTLATGDIIIDLKGSSSDDFNLFVHIKGVIESITQIEAGGRVVLKRQTLHQGFRI